MASSGAAGVDPRILLAGVAAVVALVLLVAVLIRDLRAGRGVQRSTRLLAFFIGVVAVAAVALIGVALLS